MTLLQPSFIVIPVGGDEHTSRDEVVEAFRARLSRGSFAPMLYVVDDPWVVLSIATHVNQSRAGIDADDATAGSIDHNRRV